MPADFRISYHLVSCVETSCGLGYYAKAGNCYCCSPSRPCSCLVPHALCSRNITFAAHYGATLFDSHSPILPHLASSPGQSHLIFGIGSISCFIISQLSKLCRINTLYRTLKNLDAIALASCLRKIKLCNLSTLLEL